MRYTRATAVAIGAFMLVLPSAYMVDAKGSGHDEGDPMIITMPPTGEMSCAVYFADNMVFAPQWRTDNLVRIEMMIIDMTDFGGDPRAIEIGTINLSANLEVDYPAEYPEYNVKDPVTEEVLYWDQQDFLLNDSTRLSLTSMVSVSYMRVTIIEQLDEASTEIPHSEMFEAGWLDEYPYGRVIFSEPGLSELGREVNKHGNLIYGMSWDTSNAPEGTYRVDVQLGRTVPNLDGEGYHGEIGLWYTVAFAVGHLYIGDGVLFDDDHPYVSLVPDVSADTQIDINLDPEGESNLVYLYDDLGIGLGGLDSDNTAWVLLGPLIGQGPGGGNGGDSGGPGRSQYRGEDPHV
jgi:hypothetical protein